MFCTEAFPFVKHVEPRTANVDNLGAAVTIPFEHGAFPAVIGVRVAGSTADDAAALEIAKVAFIADVDFGSRPHISVTENTLAVALLTQSPNSYRVIRYIHTHILVPTPGCFLHIMRSGLCLAAI